MKKRNCPKHPASCAPKASFNDEQRKIIAVAVHETKLAVLTAIIEALTGIRAEATYGAE